MVGVGAGRFGHGVVNAVCEAAVRAAHQRAGRDEAVGIRVRRKQRANGVCRLGQRAGRDTLAVVGKNPGLAALTVAQPVRLLAHGADIAREGDAGDEIALGGKEVARLDDPFAGACADACVLHAAAHAEKPVAERLRLVLRRKAFGGVFAVCRGKGNFFAIRFKDRRHEAEQGILHLRIRACML